MHFNGAQTGLNSQLKFASVARVRFKLEVIIITAMLQHVIKSKHEAEIADDAATAHPDGAFKAATAKASIEKRYLHSNRSKLVVVFKVLIVISDER